MRMSSVRRNSRAIYGLHELRSRSYLSARSRGRALDDDRLISHVIIPTLVLLVHHSGNTGSRGAERRAADPVRQLRASQTIGSCDCTLS